MASGKRCWEEAITRAVQGAVRSVLTDKEVSTSNQFSPPASNATCTGSSSKRYEPGVYDLHSVLYK
jgi:hypothetical protein